MLLRHKRTEPDQTGSSVKRPFGFSSRVAFWLRPNTRQMPEQTSSADVEGEAGSGLRSALFCQYHARKQNHGSSIITSPFSTASVIRVDLVPTEGGPVYLNQRTSEQSNNSFIVRGPRWQSCTISTACPSCEVGRWRRRTSCAHFAATVSTVSRPAVRRASRNSAEPCPSSRLMRLPAPRRTMLTLQPMPPSGS